MSNNDDIKEDEDLMITPGKILCDARVKLGLSIKDMSKQTCLSTTIICDIESDDYTHIAAPIFIRGYILACARVLQLNEEDILLSLKSIMPSDNYNTEMKYAARVERSSLVGLLFKYPLKVLLLSFGILLFAGWVISHEVSSGNAVSLELSANNNKSTADVKPKNNNKNITTLSLTPNLAVTKVDKKHAEQH